MPTSRVETRVMITTWNRLIGRKSNFRRGPKRPCAKASNRRPATTLRSANKRYCDRGRERERRFASSRDHLAGRLLPPRPPPALVLLRRREQVAVAPSGPQALSRRRTSSSAPSASATPARSYPDPEEQLPFWQQNFFLVILLLMALSLFALSILLYLGLEFPEGSPAPATAAQEGVEITYGSVIKLMHERTKFRLHSHDVPYGSGSGQQSVTGFPNVDDSNSYWIVKSPPDSSAKQGDVIPSGTIIRLQHMRTRRWLHSHLHASPISGNLEVSCFGADGQSDTGDFWRLEIEGSGKTWRQDQRMRLRHIDTSGYLHSHDKKYTRIAGGQQEVCGVREKRPDNVWLAAEGVYLPINASK